MKETIEEIIVEMRNWDTHSFMNKDAHDYVVMLSDRIAYVLSKNRIYSKHQGRACSNCGWFDKRWHHCNLHDSLTSPTNLCVGNNWKPKEVAK